MNCEFLVGLENNRFIRACYPIEGLELKLAHPKILVIHPPKSLAKAFSSLFRANDSDDAIVSITALSSCIVTVNSSGMLRVWNSAEKMKVLAEGVIGDRPNIYKVVAKSKDALVKIAVAFESCETLCVSVHSFTVQGLEMLSVLSAPCSSVFKDLDLNDSMMVVAWQTSERVILSCYSFNEAGYSQVLEAENESETDFKVQGVTCTDGFAAVVRDKFVGLLRSPVSPLESMSWLAGSLCSRYYTFVDTADAEHMRQLRIEVQGYEVEGVLALVRMWRPQLKPDENIMTYLDRIRDCDLPYHIGILIGEFMTSSFEANFLSTHNSLQKLLINSPLGQLDTSTSAWPHSVLHLFSQALISLSYSLTELALDLLVVAQLTLDKAELFDKVHIFQMQEFTATAESCLAVFRGLSYRPKNYNAAPAVTMILAERSGALIGYSDYVDVQAFTAWTESAIKTIFQHLKLLITDFNNSASPQLAELLSCLGQPEAVVSMLEALPPCYAGLEFEHTLSTGYGIERVSVLADAPDQQGLREFMGGRWWKFTSSPTMNENGLQLDFLSLVCNVTAIPATIRCASAWMLAFVAQGRPESDKIFVEAYHSLIKSGALKAAYSILNVINDPAPYLIAMAEALFATGKLHEIPTAQTRVRSQLVEAVRELAARELFNIDIPLQCNRYADDFFLIYNHNLKSTNPFVGYHELLFQLELQTHQFTAAAATMYSYALKVEQALKLEGYKTASKDSCRRLQRHALLCSSVALQSSTSIMFIAETYTRRSRLKRTAEGNEVKLYGDDVERVLVTKNSLQQKLAELLHV